MDKGKPRRLMISVRADSETAVTKNITNAGAKPVPNFEPVPIKNADGSWVTVLTMDVPNQDVQEQIEKMPGVVQIYGDPQIAPSKS